MAKFKFSIPTRDANGRTGVLSGSVSAPDNKHSTRQEVRNALEDHARQKGYEPIEIGLYPDNS